MLLLRNGLGLITLAHQKQNLSSRLTLVSKTTTSVRRGCYGYLMSSKKVLQRGINEC